MSEKQAAKGREGEQRIADAIQARGYRVLFIGGAVANALEGTKFAEADLFCFGKGKSFLVQVKHKEPRQKQADTGLELWRFEALKQLEQKAGIPVILLFTDATERIYGDWVAKLPPSTSETGGNQWNGQQMVYFWINRLKEIPELLGG